MILNYVQEPTVCVANKMEIIGEGDSKNYITLNQSEILGE